MIAPITLVDSQPAAAGEHAEQVLSQAQLYRLGLETRLPSSSTDLGAPFDGLNTASAKGS